jgi:hypothetical protein
MERIARPRRFAARAKDKALTQQAELTLARDAEAPGCLYALFERQSHETRERNALIDSQVACRAQEIVWQRHGHVGHQLCTLLTDSV